MLLLTALLCAVAAADSLPEPVDPLDTVDLSSRTVILSADDGHVSIYANVYPLLKRHRMPLTLGVIGDYVRGRGGSYGHAGAYMSRAQVQEMIDSCAIEIASHSMSHAWLTRVSQAQAWREIDGSRFYLESLFGQPVITFVYPYGDMNAEVRNMVREAGYRLGRAVRPGLPNFWTDPYRLPTVELRREISLTEIKRRIAGQDVTILLFHRIVPRPTVFTEWSSSDFAALLDWLARRGVRVTTLADHYRFWWRQHLEQILRERTWFDPAVSPGRLFEDVDVDAARTTHTR